MGVEYGLYDMANREFIHLGKAYYELSGFQMSADRIVAFIKSRIDAEEMPELRIFDDAGNLPDEDESAGWKQLDSWHWENGKPPPDSGEFPAVAS
jgi:hypothetical protein